MPKSREVDAWFARYENPMKDVVMRVREIVLASDARIDECIKWAAPTFVYQGNLASFFPKSKAHASLMFHEGARIPGTHAILEGTAELGRSIKIASVEEAEKKRAAIARVVRAWCDWRDAGPAKKATAKKTAAGAAASAKKKTAGAAASAKKTAAGAAASAKKTKAKEGHT